VAQQASAPGWSATFVATVEALGGQVDLSLVAEALGGNKFTA
jgi:hypothetical protein